MKYRLLLSSLLLSGVLGSGQQPQSVPPAKPPETESQQPQPSAPVKTNPSPEQQPAPEKAPREETGKAPEAQHERPIDLIWGLKIPMRDGVRLNGTVYKPAAQKEPLPVIQVPPRPSGSPAPCHAYLTTSLFSYILCV